MFPVYFGKPSTVFEGLSLVHGLVLGALTLCLLPSQEKGDSNQEAKVGKTEEQVKVEVELIEKRATENYEAEKSKNGLIIRMGFYGPKLEIEQIRQASNKLDALLAAPSTLAVTTALRFYTKNGLLRLPASSKSKLYGFMCKNPEIPKEDYRLYIIQEMDGIVYEHVVTDSEDIHIQKLN